MAPNAKVPAFDRLHQAGQNFARARCGTTALEFALVAPVFLLLVLMIIENGLMLFAQAVLDNATVDAARQIQIGKAKTSTDFQNYLCPEVTSFLNCTNLSVYVNSSPIGFPPAVLPLSSGMFAVTPYLAGSGGNYVLVEVAYNRAYVSPWLISIGPANWILLSTQAFQNEPFS